MKKYFLIFSLIMAGCANPEIVELSPDTYLLYRDDHAGVFGNSGRLRAGVIKDANIFAASKGKVAIPISSNFTPVGGGPGQWASFEYQFRVVDKNDKEAIRTSLQKRADIVVEKSITIDSNHESQNVIKSESNSNDIYSELLKIDDLKQKGIISEEEFLKMKLDIINNQ